MRNCYQFENLSVLGHGIAVMRKAGRLYREDWAGFKLPDWFAENWAKIKESLYDWRTIKRYAIWHDISKPYCRTVDENGKQHFPEHAAQSCKIFLDKVSNSPIVGQLIADDMLFHTVKAEQLDENLKSAYMSKSHLFTLLFVSLAELHANADMFGGTDSISFKMKYKQLDKRGKQLLKFYGALNGN